MIGHSNRRPVEGMGRRGAATLRLLTVNHGAQRITGTAAQQPYSAVMGSQVRIYGMQGVNGVSWLTSSAPRHSAEPGLMAGARGTPP
jgi:hypothetical protein